MDRIKHFIWDFDGTLFDTYPVMVHAFQKALADCGVIAHEKEIYTHMMDSLTDTFHYYTNEYGLGDRLGERHYYYLEQDMEGSQPFLSAKDLCEFIDRTGRCNYLCTHRGQTANQFIEKYGFTGYFKELVTSQNKFQRKPDPEALLYLMHKYGMQQEETIMVGDRELDIQCGKNAGVLTCYIQNGQQGNPFDADYYYADIPSMYDYCKLLLAR